MDRRVIWKRGDSPPAWGTLSIPVTDPDGEIDINLDFSVSAAMVTFARHPTGFAYGYDYTPDAQPLVYVSAVTETGFVVHYEKVNDGTLFLSYIAW